MSLLVIKVCASVLAHLPLKWNHRCGCFIGWLAWALNTKLRNNTEYNLQLCFPQWSTEKRKRIARRSLLETGMALTEAFWIWQRPAADIEKKISFSDSITVLHEAQRSSKGLIVATPHMGAWEVCNFPLSRKTPMTYFYRPPRMSQLEDDLIKWRGNLNAIPARLDQSGIKYVLKTLKKGNTVGVLPDQEPSLQAGCFAPFFNVPANTMTLLARIAHKSQAQILFCFAERLPKGAGWKMHYLEPEPNTNHQDKLIATTALNRTVERCIEHCPTQYMWNYKRFRILEDGSPRDYQFK